MTDCSPKKTKKKDSCLQASLNKLNFSLSSELLGFEWSSGDYGDYGDPLCPCYNQEGEYIDDLTYDDCININGNWDCEDPNPIIGACCTCNANYRMNIPFHMDAWRIDCWCNNNVDGQNCDKGIYNVGSWDTYWRDKKTWFPTPGSDTFLIAPIPHFSEQVFHPGKNCSEIEDNCWFSNACECQFRENHFISGVFIPFLGTGVWEEP